MPGRRAPELSDATGLTVPMVDWASRTTLDTVRQDTLLALARKASLESGQSSGPITMLAVVLAGNVFTASVRSIVVPLLLGVPVLVKASSKEITFPTMLRDALRRTNATLGAAIDIVAFPGGDAGCETALVERAEAVSVYGSDETVAAMASRVDHAPLIPHGHGVSVAYCGAVAMDDARQTDTIANLSLDICAYDQRGCLSPQLVFIEAATDRSARDFALRLAEEGLDPMSQTLPRGPLPASVGAEQTQWRGLAEVEGTLIRGKSFGLAIRSAQAARWSPGYRNVSIVPVRTMAEAVQRDRTYRRRAEVHRRRPGIDPRGPSAPARKPRAQRVRMQRRVDANTRPRRTGGWISDLARAAPAAIDDSKRDD